MMNWTMKGWTKKRWIIIGTITTVVLSSSLGGLAYLGYLGEMPEISMPDISMPEFSMPDIAGLFSSSAEPETEKGKALEPEEPDVAPLYMALEPPFVVNFTHQGTLRYLQTDILVMTPKQETLDKLRARLPPIRNDIILYLSEQNYETLASKEAKEKLRADIKQLINKVIRRRKEPGISEVYFTSFIMQ